MKKTLYVFVLFLGLSSCQESEKITFVDFDSLINEYQEKKDLDVKFETKENLFRRKFDSIDNAFEMEVQKYRLQANKIAKQKAEEQAQELGKQKQINEQKKQVEAQQFRKEFKAEMDSIIVTVKRFVRNYGKENGYTYILGASETAATVLYGKVENDLTKTILDGLNKEYKK